jgi:hypothetical protein
MPERYHFPASGSRSPPPPLGRSSSGHSRAHRRTRNPGTSGANDSHDVLVSDDLRPNTWETSTYQSRDIHYSHVLPESACNRKTSAHTSRRLPCDGKPAASHSNSKKLTNTTKEQYGATRKSSPHSIAGSSSNGYQNVVAPLAYQRDAEGIQTSSLSSVNRSPPSNRLNNNKRMVIPPKAPQIPRLPTPDLNPPSYHDRSSRFCPCCSTDQDEDTTRWAEGRGKMDQQSELHP